jgi:flagellar motor switch protein FliN/FliY
LVGVDVANHPEAKALLTLTPNAVAYLSDMMLGEEDSSREEITEDDLDAAKEMVSNIFGAINTTLLAQKDIEKISFSISKVEHIMENGDLSLEDYSTMFAYNFSLGSMKSLLSFIVNESLEELLSGKKAPAQATASIGDTFLDATQSGDSKASLNSSELANISLIMDVKLPVKVRIGRKKMLLKDVLNMDIGSVIELNQLANDPLEVLVDDHVIAEGEVVIVDGNFGIQITTIGTKRERLNQLRS